MSMIVFIDCFRGDQLLMDKELEWQGCHGHILLWAWILTYDVVCYGSKKAKQIYYIK